MGISKIDERGRITIPRNVREKAGLKQGDKVRVLLERGRVVVEHLVDFETFTRELRGCITIPGDFNPLDLKEIWRSNHDHR